MKTVLVYPPVPVITTSIQPPVGLAYLASILLKKGSDVYVVSSVAEGLSVGETVSRILDLSPDIVGITIPTTNVNASLKIISGVKEKMSDLKIMVGGPHPTLFPDEFLEKNVDFVIRGEGENTLSELYDCINQNKSLDGVRGISYKKSGRSVHNPDRELINDLDTIPFPSWELFPVKGYKSDFRKKEFSLPVLTSRGCPERCTFCYKGIFGNRFRVRRPDRIAEEIKYLKNKFRIEEFVIIDDSFTSNPKRAMEVCDMMVSNKIDLPWTLGAGIRVSTVSRELLEKLKAAGCYRVCLGIESGNQGIINSVKKAITLDQVRKAVKLLKEFKIESVGYFMIGNLEETEQTIDQTIDFAVELDPDYAQFSKATPYPGTAIYNQLKNEKRIITDNWDDYDAFLRSKPVFAHKNLSSEKIDNKLSEAYRKFYCRPKRVLKYLREIGSFREAVNFIKNVPKFFTKFLR